MSRTTGSVTQVCDVTKVWCAQRFQNPSHVDGGRMSLCRPDMLLTAVSALTSSAVDSAFECYRLQLDRCVPLLRAPVCILSAASYRLETTSGSTCGGNFGDECAGTGRPVVRDMQDSSCCLSPRRQCWPGLFFLFLDR